MDPLAFRAALRATARVALGVTAFGCGGTVAFGPDAGPGVAVAKADAAATAEASAAVVGADAQVVVDAARAASACHAPAHADSGAAIDQTTFDCCVALVASFGPPDAAVTASELPDAGEPGAEIASCCAAIVARLDYDHASEGMPPDASTWTSDENASAPVQWACCSAAHEPIGPTCTPWGPPTPPAMPQRLLEVA